MGQRVGRLVAVAAVGAWALSAAFGSAATSAASSTYTVDMVWDRPVPECVDAIVCSGVGTGDFEYGVPFESSAATSLSVVADPLVTQPGAAAVRAGTLEYCNGSTLSGTNVDSVDLVVTVDVPAVGQAVTAETTLLVNSVNTDDPIESADQLSFAGDPTRILHVLEDECATVEVRTRVTVGDGTTVEVSIGDILTPETGYISDEGRREVELWVKPAINLGAKGLIPMVVMGSELNDVTLIDQSTVRFEGGAPAKQKVTDANGDGIADLHLHVPYESLTTLLPDATVACATFETITGDALVACDDVVIVPKHRR